MTKELSRSSMSEAGSRRSPIAASLCFSALALASCASRPADAVSSATLSIPATSEPGPARETKSLIVLAASPGGSTAKVAHVIAEELEARSVGLDQRDAVASGEYSLISFGSGIFDAKNHPSLLAEKGYEIVGEFGCPGFNDNSFLKLFGGINRGRPNAADLEGARSFARDLRM